MTRPLQRREVHVGRVDFLDMADTVLGAGGRLWVVNRGHSMHPTIVDGAEVLIEAVVTPSIGDVVVIRQEPICILHRLVRREGTALVTRGDACLADDQPVDRDGLMARAIATRQHGRIVALRYAPSLGALALGRRLAADVRRFGRSIWTRFRARRRATSARAAGTPHSPGSGR